MSLPEVFNTLQLPAVGAPLFIISNPDLVIAQCKADVVARLKKECDAARMRICGGA